MIPTPAEIKAELDRYVVGQEQAKRTLATAVSNHYRRVAYTGETAIGKSNVLLIGPTGTGKTFMVQTVARMLNVPFEGTNATAITPSGWAGDDPEHMVMRLWKNAKIKKTPWEVAQRGIVYIDEIDKIAARSAEQRITPSGGFSITQVQQSLLKIIEGALITVDGNPFSTERILFVGSGAFVGLEDIVNRRERGAHFTRALPDPKPLRRVQVRDFIEYGFIPEFIGRFPVTAALDPLTESDVLAILRDVKDSLMEQFTALLSTSDVTLEIEELKLREIARAAIVQRTGARGLRTALEKMLEPVLFDPKPGSHIRIGSHGIEIDSRAGTPKRTSSETLPDLRPAETEPARLTRLS